MIDLAKVVGTVAVCVTGVATLLLLFVATDATEDVAAGLSNVTTFSALVGRESVGWQLVDEAGGTDDVDA